MDVGGLISQDNNYAATPSYVSSSSAIPGSRRHHSQVQLQALNHIIPQYLIRDDGKLSPSPKTPSLTLLSGQTSGHPHFGRRLDLHLPDPAPQEIWSHLRSNHNNRSRRDLQIQIRFFVPIFTLRARPILRAPPRKNNPHHIPPHRARIQHASRILLHQDPRGRIPILLSMDPTRQYGDLADLKPGSLGRPELAIRGDERTCRG